MIDELLVHDLHSLADTVDASTDLRSLHRRITARRRRSVQGKAAVAVVATAGFVGGLVALQSGRSPSAEAPAAAPDPQGSVPSADPKGTSTVTPETTPAELPSCVALLAADASPAGKEAGAPGEAAKYFGKVAEIDATSIVVRAADPLGAPEDTTFTIDASTRWAVTGVPQPGPAALTVGQALVLIYSTDAAGAHLALDVNVDPPAASSDDASTDGKVVPGDTLVPNGSATPDSVMSKTVGTVTAVDGDVVHMTVGDVGTPPADIELVTTGASSVVDDRPCAAAPLQVGDVLAVVYHRDPTGANVADTMILGG
jgi:hypothetical protein